MELGNSDDRVYAAERILKKRVKKVSAQKWKIGNINIKTTTNTKLRLNVKIIVIFFSESSVSRAK